jgi:excisionase family DNA binding protein
MTLASLAALPTLAERGALLSVDKAASYLGLSATYLNKLRTQGGGPAFHKVGVRVLYRPSDLDDWLSDKRRTSTSDTGDRG